MADLHHFEYDTFSTHRGDLSIYFLGHASLLIQWNGKNIYVDPFSRVADYSQMPNADLVLITHEHIDHLDPQALNAICTPHTHLIVTERCAEKLGTGMVMRNGDHMVIEELTIEAVPAYNVVHKRDNGQPFHPKGVGNGYVVTFDPLRIYIAGDTENIEEMRNLKRIDIAFLPMNLPYTMTPEMLAEAALCFRPRVLYPYHFSDTPLHRIVELLKDAKDIDVRLRKLA